MRRPPSGCWAPPTPGCIPRRFQASDARFERPRPRGRTFSALILKGRELHLVHVGDSRIYRLHAQASNSSPATTGYACRPPSPTSAALGTGPTWRSTTAAGRPRPGEIYLLATDGAYTHLDAARCIHAAWPPPGRPRRRRRPARQRARTRQRRRRDPAAPAHRRPPEAGAPPAAAPGRPRPAAAAGPTCGVRGLHPSCASCSRRPQPPASGHLTRRQRGRWC